MLCSLAVRSASSFSLPVMRKSFGSRPCRLILKIGGATSLQPVLYALAAEKLFEGEARVTAGRLYFCTSAGGYVDHVVPLNDGMRAAACEVAEVIGGAIAKQFLPAAPAKRQCERCDYLAVCGPYEEHRAARKPKEDIEALLRLRERP